MAYRDFLADPQPADRWCGVRSRERWSPLWRPFEGPLGPSAQRQAITILKNLYGFLSDQNYLMGNPWSAVSVPKSSEPKVNAGRSLTVAQWRFVGRELEMLPATSASQRLRFALRLLYATGLRLSEVVVATVDDLQWVEYPADAVDGEPLEGWMLKVLGKGNKERQVPLPIELVAELSAYLSSRTLDPDPESVRNRGGFLLGVAAAADGPAARGDGVEFDAHAGIADSTLYGQLKRFFAESAETLQSRGDLKGAERLRAASTHWLRHSHASHAIASGMPIEIVQQNLGHASLATTTVYVTTEGKRRMKAMETFWKR